MPSPGVKARIDRFWRAIKRLEDLQLIDLKDFIKDENAIDAAERNLHVAIEAMIDVCEALISYMKWRTPRSYRDVGKILGDRGLLSHEEVVTFEEAVRLRNILVHNYIYISPHNVYKTIRELRMSLVKIVSRVLDYMRTQNIDP